MQLRSDSAVTRGAGRRAGAAVLALGRGARRAVGGAAWPTPPCRATARRCKTLLQQGRDVNAAQGDGMTALHWAAMKNDAELAQMLVYAGANVKATTRLGGNTPLVIAARNGNAAGGGGAAQGRRRREGRRPPPARRR